MKFRLLTFLALILLSLHIFADKKMTIRNTDTGESFEVTVPDGLKISEFDSNWSDSVPYLMERARYDEPWAYEALGDCYRYGKGGVDRSFFTATAYYDLAGKDVDRMMEQAVVDKPLDYLSLVYKLLGKLERSDKQGVLCLLDTLNEEGYHEAEILKDFLGETYPDSITTITMPVVLSEDSGTDQTLFAIYGCSLRNWYPEVLGTKEELMNTATKKIPYLYNEFAMKFFREDHNDMDSTTLAQKTSKVISYLEHADQAAMLSRNGAKILYNHYLSESDAGRMTLDEEIVNRLAIIARVNDSEIIVLTDE